MTTAATPAASYLLGIAHPEGDGMEVDEAASLVLKGRGKEVVCAAIPVGCDSFGYSSSKWNSSQCNSCKCTPVTWMNPWLPALMIFCSVFHAGCSVHKAQCWLWLHGAKWLQSIRVSAKK